MKVVIIEEEEMIASRLRADMLQSQQRPEQIDHFTDFFDFVRYLKVHQQPDLLLVDSLQLNNKAMRYLQEGKLSSPLLFTNTFKYASIGNAGLSQELPAKLQQVNQVKSMLQPEESNDMVTEAIGRSSSRLYQARFLVKTRDKLLSIPADEIALFYAEGRLNFMKTKSNKKFVLNHSIETLTQSLLNPEKFFRVNRSTIVAFDDIKEMYSYFGGRIKLVLGTAFDKEIVVSRDKVAAFKRWLGE